MREQRTEDETHLTAVAPLGGTMIPFHVPPRPDRSRVRVWVRTLGPTVRLFLVRLLIFGACSLPSVIWIPMAIKAHGHNSVDARVISRTPLSSTEGVVCVEFTYTIESKVYTVADCQPGRLVEDYPVGADIRVDYWSGAPDAARLFIPLFEMERNALVMVLFYGVPVFLILVFLLWSRLRSVWSEERLLQQGARAIGQVDHLHRESGAVRVKSKWRDPSGVVHTITSQHLRKGDVHVRPGDYVLLYYSANTSVRAAHHVPIEPVEVEPLLTRGGQNTEMNQEVSTPA